VFLRLPTAPKELLGVLLLYVIAAVFQVPLKIYLPSGEMKAVIAVVKKSNFPPRIIDACTVSAVCGQGAATIIGIQLDRENLKYIICLLLHKLAGKKLNRTDFCYGLPLHVIHLLTM
jgi:hypothetical protein